MALATAKGWNSWFTKESIIEPKKGGKVYFKWENWGPDSITCEESGAVLEYLPGEKFTFSWSPGNLGFSSRVEIVFKAAKGGTVVRLKEDGYPDSKAANKVMLDCSAGWGEALTLAKMYLEHGITY